MLLFTIFVLVVIQWLSWIKYKDLLNPAVIQNVFWILSLLGLYYYSASMNISVKTSLMIIAGSVLFQIGYSQIKVKPSYNTNNRIELKSDSIRNMVLLLAVPFSLTLYAYIKSGIFIQATVFQALSSVEDELELPAYISYTFKFIQYSSLAFLLLYWKAEESLAKKKTKKWLIVLFAMAILSVLASPTRNGLLFYFAPLLMIFLYTHNLKTRQVLVILLLGLSLFMAYFYYVSLNKFWYEYDASTSPMSKLKEEIVGYLSASIYALDYTISSHEFTRMGANTFRFFLATYDSIFHTSLAPKLVNDFEGKEMVTNVFTFYDYYLRDFGAIYAVLMQFFYSKLHAIIYKKARTGSMFCMVFAAMLSYPLIMQFFQDQYISLLSLWIQLVIVLYIVFCTHLFYSKKQLS